MGSVNEHGLVLLNLNFMEQIVNYVNAQFLFRPGFREIVAQEYFFKEKKSCLNIKSSRSIHLSTAMSHYG